MTGDQMTQELTSHSSELDDMQEQLFNEEVQHIKQAGEDYYNMFLKPFVDEKDIEKDKETFVHGYVSGWYKRTIL